MFEKVGQLLRLLLHETRANRVEWEFFSEDSMIRARVGANLLRIQREGGACGGDEVENGPEATIVYNIWIIDRRGVVCGEVTLTPREAEYPLAKELFETAWGKARNTNEVLDDMIRALSVKG